MNISPQEKADKLIKNNFNHLLKIPHIPHGDETISKNYLNYLMIVSKLIASSHIRNILEDNLTQEQTQYYTQVLEEILNQNK